MAPDATAAPVQARSAFATQAGGGPIRIVRKGDLYPHDHPVVKANPTRFAALTLAAVAAYPVAAPVVAAQAEPEAPAAPDAPATPETVATPADAPDGGTSAPTEPDAATQGDVGGEPDLSVLTRADLNELAAAAGIAGADALPNKAAVIEAILAAKAAKA